MRNPLESIFPTLGEQMMTDRFASAWRIQRTADGDADDITAPEVLRNFYDELGYDSRRLARISSNALDVVLDEIKVPEVS